jgi:tetratricopeptide (TPR) repeat protein
MKVLFFKSFFIALAITAVLSSSAVAQRIIRGTVYRDGKVAAGVTVDGQKSTGSFMTSFDGIYEINVPEKCKYLRFTFIDDSRKLDIETNTSNVIDFSFDGVKPAAVEEVKAGVSLKSHKELVEAEDKDYMNTITIEKQFYDQKDYKSALAPWRVLFKSYPKASLNIYIQGINMYQAMIDAAPDRKTKNLYLDTLMMVYDQRIKYFDQRGAMLGRQGADYFKYKLDLMENESYTPDQQKAMMKKGNAYLSESVKLIGDESEIPVLVLLMNSTNKLFVLGEFTKDQVVQTYELTSKIMNKALAKDPVSKKYLDGLEALDQIFLSGSAADCASLISIYEPRYDIITQNLEDLKKMLRLLDRQGCDDSPLYAKGSEKLYELEPSAEAAYNMARFFFKSNQLDKAKEYYAQAIEREKDPMNLSKYYYELATLNFESSPQVTRSLLKKSIENNASNGKALMMLGDVYAHNSKMYGENDYERSLVFLVSVDYYAKAKKADPSLESDANKKISDFSKYFPSKEDIFFYGMTVGQSYTLGGWIGETTTIRDKR